MEKYKLIEIPDDIRIDQIFLLDIRDYSEGIPKGYVKLMYDNWNFCFRGADQLVLILDYICDRKMPEYSQSEKREFSEKKREYFITNCICEPGKHEISGDKKFQKRCVVHMMYRSHTSLQGMLEHKGKRVCFRSALELIGLIHACCMEV